MSSVRRTNASERLTVGLVVSTRRTRDKSNSERYSREPSLQLTETIMCSGIKQLQNILDFPSDALDPNTTGFVLGRGECDAEIRSP